MGARFLVDAMLGRTAIKLRMAGFDAEYEQRADDSGILEAASAGDRVIITRDAELFRRARKAGIPALVPRGEDSLDHLMQIAEALGLGPVEIDPSRSRCAGCNGRLEPYPEGEPRPGQMPDGAPDPRRCASCGHAYWRGSHVDSLRRELGARYTARETPPRR